MAGLDEASSDDGLPKAVKRAPRTAAPKVWGDPPGTSMCTLSHASHPPKWRFGTASRSGKGAFNAKVTLRSRSSPELTQKPASCKSASVEEPPSDAGSTLEGVSSMHNITSRGTWSGSWRMDGSVEPHLDKWQKARYPETKYYDASITMGAGTAPTIEHAPHFTFGGGPSRMKDFEKREEQLSRLRSDSKARVSNAHALEMANKAVKAQEWQAWEEEAERLGHGRRTLSRTFGTEKRLRHRSGALDLPVSPGPAAYSVPRDHSPAKPWQVKSAMPWGIRSENRPSHKIQTDIGPGEYCADHPFEAAKGAPILGHPLQEVVPTSGIGAGPTPEAYTLPSTLGGPQIGIGRGKRPKEAAERSPGPARYDQDYKPLQPRAANYSVGRQLRLHWVDMLDEDDLVPGPGAHDVVQEPGTKVPSASGFKHTDAKCKTIHGMGPVGYPHAEYEVREGPSTLRAKSLGGSQPRRIRESPGPGEYDHEDDAIRPAAPLWGSPQRTGPKSKLFDAKEDPSAAKGQEWAKSAQKKTSDTAWRPSGPKYSMPGRGSAPGFSRAPELGATMYGAVSSMSC